MNTTNTLVTSPNINGNIGSCQINTTDSTVDTFHTMTIAINSCNGEIVNKNIHIESTWIILPIVILSIFAFVDLVLYVATPKYD